MNLDRTDLEKTMRGFDRIANRLMRAPHSGYKQVLKTFLEYIDTTGVIKEFIDDCGLPSFNVAYECNRVASYGNGTFKLGKSKQQEVANIYGILKYLQSSDIHIPSLGMTQTPSPNKHQNKLKEFNEQVLVILIYHIEEYLTEIAFDINKDESPKYVITSNAGQVNLTCDNAAISATQINDYYSEELQNMIMGIKKELPALNDNERNDVDECLEVIEIELKSNKPRNSMVKTALSALRTIKGTGEFGTTVTALGTFIAKMLGWPNSN
jgi:hypothetical protein